MREYYKEKLANIREIFRGVILFFIALISGVGGMIFNLLNEFKVKIFILFTFSFINAVIVFWILVKLYKVIDNYTEKLKE